MNVCILSTCVKTRGKDRGMRKKNKRGVGKRKKRLIRRALPLLEKANEKKNGNELVGLTKGKRTPKGGKRGIVISGERKHLSKKGEKNGQR